MFRAISRTLIFPLFMMALFVINGCSPSDGRLTGGEGFAIYFPVEDVKASQVTSLSDLHPDAEPLVSIKDIVSYSRNTHEITLTSQAYSRLDEIIGMAKVPTWGKVFIVCVDRRPVYWGAFWPAYSSQSFDGVTIPIPLVSDRNAIQITLGYPGTDFYRGEDPRLNPEILKSLEETGKLK